MLDGIERVGNKVPHPAIIFLGLVRLVIVLSAVLAAFDVSVTYDVVEAPPVVAEEEYVGGSVEPETIVPPEDYLDEELEIVQETTPIESLLGGRRRRGSSSRRSSTTSPGSASSPSSSSP